MVHFSLGHMTPSASSSRPGSRAPSPTRSNSTRTPATAPRSSISSGGPADPLNDYFTTQPHQINSGSSTPAVTPGAASTISTSATGTSTPAYGSYSDRSDMWGSGAVTPGGSYFPHHPVEIILDNDRLVMRGQGGDMNPAYLSGRVELNLTEPTNIKEIHMSLHGKAKVHFSDGGGTGSKNHHFTHHVLTHDWSFLQGEKKHTHTLKAGHHSFPFSLTLHGNLPSSIHTFSGDATIVYKMHATVVRSGFASNFHDVKYFSLHRTYTSDALEFNQTLEIENTWPGKIMYAITLPFKAYAAGDEIPVNVKFMPLAKGVRVTSVTSVIKEYSLVHTRHSNHPDQRVASSVKHELRNGQAYLVTEELVRPPSHWAQSGRADSYRSMNGSIAGTPAARTPLVSSVGRANSYFTPTDNAASSSSSAGPSAGPSTGDDTTSEEDVEIGDDEVNTHFTIPIPAWTTPSHAIHPVFITHKLKWSCSISNADGHVSELRCALPIIILENSLLEEARAAGASTRGLLFGGAASEEAQAVDLPSYSNHVYDRVAYADSGSTSGFIPRPQNSGPPSHSSTPHSLTPPVSRGPSRPGSPTGHRGGDADDLPPRRELSSWADSELLLSLGALQTHSNGSSPNSTPAASRGPSRPLSRRNSRSGRSSRVGSRANSRASSPERGTMSPMTGADEPYRPPPERRHTGGLQGLLHLPSSLKNRNHNGAKPILRNSSHIGLTSLNNEGIQRNSVSFTNLNDRNNAGGSGGGRVQFANEPTARARFHVEADSGSPEADEEEDNMDPINRVPSYAIASRGFLGGGVVPIDVGLPTYDDSERSTSVMARSHRSDTALVDLGAGAHAAAEERAGEEGEAAGVGRGERRGSGDVAAV